MNVVSRMVALGVLASSTGFLSCADSQGDGAEKEELGNTVSAISGEGHVWQHGDWTDRILYEARYALNLDADGYSNIEAGSGLTKKWYSDWDYVANDSYAYSKAASEASTIGTISPALWVQSLGTSVYRGGWCTFFVRLVLCRATYWAFSDHYTTPAYPSSVYTITSSMTQNYASIQPGWVFLSPSATHYAIAEKRETVEGRIGWWLIDSNYVCTFCIGKHFMPDETLSSQGYYGWKPDRGTNN